MPGASDADGTSTTSNTGEGLILQKFRRGADVALMDAGIRPLMRDRRNFLSVSISAASLANARKGGLDAPQLPVMLVVVAIGHDHCVIMEGWALPDAATGEAVTSRRRTSCCPILLEYRTCRCSIRWCPPSAFRHVILAGVIILNHF